MADMAASLDEDWTARGGKRRDVGRKERIERKDVEVVVFRGDRAHAREAKHRGERGRKNKSSEDGAKMAEAERAEEEKEKEAFEKMKREVFQFGGRHLEGSAKKRFETERLRALGAQAAKSPRLPASVGLGLSQKRKHRIRSQLERDVASGAVSKKGSGKVLQRRLQASVGSPTTPSETKPAALNAHAAVGKYRGGVLHLHRDAKRIRR